MFDHMPKILGDLGHDPLQEILTFLFKFAKI